jgi:hypothetical protein
MHTRHHRLHSVCTAATRRAHPPRGLCRLAALRAEQTATVFAPASTDNAGGCLLVRGRVALTLDTVGIEGGNAVYGGGIGVLDAVSVDVSDTTVRRSAGRMGGGVYAQNTRLWLSDSVLEGNRVFSNSSECVDISGESVATSAGGGGLATRNCVAELVSTNMTDNSGVAECTSNTFYGVAGGGGVMAQGGNLSVSSSNVTGNVLTSEYSNSKGCGI